MCVKQRKGWRMSCDVCKVTEGLENELWRRLSEELILQPFRHFTYVTIHSPTLPSLYLRHSSFSNPSFASPTSHGNIGSSLTSLGESPMVKTVFNLCVIKYFRACRPPSSRMSFLVVSPETTYWFLSLRWKTCLPQNYSLGSRLQ